MSTITTSIRYGNILPTFRKNRKTLGVRWLKRDGSISNIVFLQRVSIACYAERCISYDRFCLTVWPSITRWYHAKTTPATIMRSSIIWLVQGQLTFLIKKSINALIMHN